MYQRRQENEGKRGPEAAAFHLGSDVGQSKSATANVGGLERGDYFVNNSVRGGKTCMDVVGDLLIAWEAMTTGGGPDNEQGDDGDMA